MAITQATSLADFSTGIGTAGAVLQVDNVDGQVGIGTTDPQGTLQVGIAITMDGTAGVITASSFSGSGGNLTFTGADISAATASFTGNVSVGGTLTYEDVTNIDSVGIVTARTGVEVTANGLVINAGVSTFAADLSIADKIVHTGDTNTAIRFPAADTFTVETGGTEAYRVDSSQKLLVGATSGTAAFAGDANNLVIVESGNTAKIVVHRKTEDAFGGILRLGKTRSSTSAIDNSDEVGAIEFFGHDSTDTNSRLAFIGCNAEADGANNDVPGRLVFATTADGASAPTERLRIDKDGRTLIGSGAISSPKSSEGGFDVCSHNLSIVFGGSSLSGTTPLRANNATKDGRIAAAHYTNTEEPVGVVRVISNSTENQVHWGGGTSIVNAPTDHRFYTAANNTTTSGTERLRITSDGSVRIVADNQKLTLGAGNDFELYHDGTNNVIATDGANIRIGTTGETFAKFVNNGAVELYYDNSKKLETSSAGVTVTGTLNASTDVTINGNSAATTGKSIAMAFIFG